MCLRFSTCISPLFHYFYFLVGVSFVQFYFGVLSLYCSLVPTVSMLVARIHLCMQLHCSLIMQVLLGARVCMVQLSSPELDLSCITYHA